MTDSIHSVDSKCTVFAFFREFWRSYFCRLCHKVDSDSPFWCSFLPDSARILRRLCNLRDMVLVRAISLAVGKNWIQIGLFPLKPCSAWRWKSIFIEDCAHLGLHTNCTPMFVIWPGCALTPRSSGNGVSSAGWTATRAPTFVENMPMYSPMSKNNVSLKPMKRIVSLSIFFCWKAKTEDDVKGKCFVALYHSGSRICLCSALKNCRNRGWKCSSFQSSCWSFGWNLCREKKAKKGDSHARQRNYSWVHSPPCVARPSLVWLKP